MDYHGRSIIDSIAASGGSDTVITYRNNDFSWMQYSGWNTGLDRGLLYMETAIPFISRTESSGSFKKLSFTFTRPPQSTNVENYLQSDTGQMNIPTAMLLGEDDVPSIDYSIVTPINGTFISTIGEDAPTTPGSIYGYSVLTKGNIYIFIKCSINPYIFNPSGGDFTNTYTFNVEIPFLR